MKEIKLLLLLIGLSVISAQSHNYFWGTVGATDRLVYSNYVQKNFFLLAIVSVEFQYPPPGVIDGRTISAIRATDQFTNGNGGFALITAGGVFHNHTTIEFTSQRSHGLEFLVEIYVKT